jgi:hypothetical protein
MSVWVLLSVEGVGIQPRARWRKDRAMIATPG